MEWNQLQRFLEVAKEENFSKAANKLQVSQPALSQMIKRLEEELGYPLFVRDGKHIRLNESGWIFMQAVAQMEMSMQNTRLRLEELNGIHHPEVAVRFSSASTILPQLLLYLKERNPQIRYRIYQLQREDDTEIADICIAAGPVGMEIPREKGGKKENTILLEEEILLALPKNHILNRKKNLTMADLGSEEFICLNEQWELGREISAELNKLLFTPKMTMFVDNPNMMRELLKAGLGIAFVPAISWKSFAGEEIVLRPVEGFRLKRNIYLQTGTSKYITKEQKECIHGIKEFFSNFVHDIA